MTIRQGRRRRNAAGQALVLMVGAMFAVVGLLGLIIDGGNAWANQRIVQNGSDAASEAGAVVMAQRFAGANPAFSSADWDAAVSSAITASAAANGISVAVANGDLTAYYTDICGVPLKPDGSAAVTSANQYDLAAADRVGSGALPIDTTSTPDCPNRIVGPAAGVLVLGQHNIATYFATLFGIHTFSVNTQSTAAAGYLQECSAAAGDTCALLPVAIPVDIVTCDKSGNAVQGPGPWVADGKTVYFVPLCKGNAAGNVGWIDWTPPGGGTSELINSIKTPNNPAINLPSWQYVTSTGNPNAAGVEDAIRAYDGQTVLIPQFDLTCGPKHGETPNQALVSDPLQNNGCLNATINDIPGSGAGSWYRIPSFANFQLCISTDPDCAAKGANFGAYINGSNSICNTGNGATSCLAGKFVSILSTGTIGPGVGGGTGSSKKVGVQLIK